MTEWILTSSVLIVVVLVLRRLLRSRISLRLRYALWTLVLVRLLIPFSLPQSKISVAELASPSWKTSKPSSTPPSAPRNMKLPGSRFWTISCISRSIPLLSPQKH